MNNKKSFKYSEILRNNWVITLTATLVGVFVALYLNEWIAERKLSNQKSIAVKNILAEITSNNETLTNTIDKHEELLEVIAFLGEYVDEEENLIAPAVEFAKFRSKFPDLVMIEDSTLVEEGVYNYNGDINLDLSFPHFELTTITWTTLKNSGIIASFDFECLLYLETIDKITNEVAQMNKELLDYFTGTNDSGDNNENLINHLKLLLDFEVSLNEIYDSGDKELSNCG